MGHNGNENSLANLKRWKPGQSGNPSGRPKGMVYPSELLAGLLAMNDDGTPKYTKADIQAIVESDDSAPALVIAARWILDGMQDGKRWVLGKDGELKPAALDPTPSRVRESLADRLEGKPVAKVEIKHQREKMPDELLDELVQFIQSNPEMIANPVSWPQFLHMLRDNHFILDRLRPLLKAHAPGLLAQLDGPIDVKARVLANADDEASSS